jgi:hypothetical protein
MAMNSFDDKRYAINNIQSLAYGHHRAENIHAAVLQQDRDEEADRNTIQGISILQNLEDEEFEHQLLNLQDPSTP